MNEIRLLLVDDEHEFREATTTALSRRGFSVVSAESGERALEVLETERPDVIVLDLRMGGMSGIDTLAELRKTNADVPVIILTGHGDLDDAVAGIRLGIVDFAHKPVDVDRLATRIRGLLVQGGLAPLSEKKIGELALPLTAYPRIRDDQTVGELVQLLRETVFGTVPGDVTEQGHRSVLVYDARDRFVGCVRIRDVLDALLPAALRGSPYASYLTGMFAGQCKLIAGKPIRTLIADQPTIDADAPLMEAVHVMVENRLINLPVLEQGRLVGMVRDKDLLEEAWRYST